MRIEDIIKICADMLGLSDASAALNGAGAMENEDVKKLLSCLDFVLDELACDYFPLKTCENISLRDCEAELSGFSRIPLKIYALKRGGKSVPFKRDFDAVKASFSGEAVIEYSFKPLKAVLSGSTEWKEDLPTARILAYGTMAEYCIVSAMIEEATLWDKRYRDALDRALRQKEAPSIRARGWY